jgi:hypothetical protein
LPGMGLTKDPSRRVRHELVYSRTHRSRWQNAPSDLNQTVPYGTVPFLDTFLAVNCQASAPWNAQITAAENAALLNRERTRSTKKGRR